MRRPRVLWVRNLLARGLFLAWMEVAPRTPQPEWDIEPLSESVWRDETCRDPVQRLLAATEGRFIDIWLPLSLERRLKAALHRMNASITCAGWEQDELFDPHEDVGIILVSAAKYGIHDMEVEDDVHYDEETGLPIDQLQEIT